MADSVLRQADAFVMVTGLVSEKNLEEVEVEKDGKKNTVIRGNIVIKTDDTNFVDFRVYVSEVMNNGKPNAAFSGMRTVMNEYQSIADVGVENATKVAVRRGQLRPNTYIGREDLKEHVNVQYSASYFNRVRDDEFEPKAECEVECCIRLVSPEVNMRGDETGRLRVGVYVPTYRGVEPMEFFVTQEMADDFSSMYEQGETGKFYLNIVNRTQVRENVIQLGLGGTRVEKSTTRINEMVLTGASTPYDENLAFSVEAIQQGLIERQQRLDKEKADMEAAKKAPKAAETPAFGGFGAPASAATKRPLPSFSGFNM